MKKLCIYHAGCLDGFTAAWIVVHKFGKENVELFPAKYGEEPPDVTDREVLVVDFSYPKQTLIEMATKAKSVSLYDHHKTAQEDLECLKGKIPGLNIVFDQTRSGCGIVFDELFSDEVILSRPNIINCIEDGDLWRFAFENTKVIRAYMYSLEFDVDTWTEVILETPFHEIVSRGKLLLIAHENNVKKVLAQTRRILCIGGYIVPAANVNGIFASDVGTELASEDKGFFAATYYDTEHHTIFSLRSSGEFDVSEIAKIYGGGGHKNAAGFKVKHSEARQFHL